MPAARKTIAKRSNSWTLTKVKETKGTVVYGNENCPVKTLYVEKAYAGSTQSITLTLTQED